jgi:hypothetical protein
VLEVLRQKIELVRFKLSPKLEHTCVYIFGSIFVIIQFSNQRNKGVYFRTVFYSDKVHI